jgi:uroporphyrin-III C-methyltransferase
LHDDLISAEILALAPPAAFIQDVGKRCGRKSIAQHGINSRLVNLALSGLNVVRLKGGDPFIFGRGGEEIEALRASGIEFEIVPGVTAALAAAASTHIPLTLRNVSSTLIFLTGHHSNETARERANNWHEFVSANATLVIYMPGQDYESTAHRLLEAGMNGDTPCALISRATTQEQQVYRTTVWQLRSAPALPAPTLLIVGEVTQPAGRALQHRDVEMRNESAEQENLVLSLSLQDVLPLESKHGDQEQSA